jgi:hypothetical protein
MKRQRKNLRSCLEHGLNKYALAAGAGGLALAQSADAKIVYTHANVPIKVDGGTISGDARQARIDERH